MEPINFEEEIREKLQEREIAVSEGAWEKLDTRLAVHRKDKSNRSFSWLAIAASLIGILMVTSIWWSSKETIPIEIVSEEINSPVEVQDQFEQEFLEEEKNSLVTLEEAAPENSSKVKEATYVPKNTSVPTTRSTTVQQRLKQENSLAAVSEIVDYKKIKTTEVEEKIATAAEVPIPIPEASDINREVEVLLLETKNTMETAASAKRKIDPNALLDDVENDLEERFRDKVFDAIGIGVEKVRTAVVDRNN